MVSTVATDVIEQIAERYRFRGDGVADALNEAGPEVAALLLEAADQIAAFFGQGTNVVLELFTDPDDEDDPGTLFALVQTPLTSAQARPVMERFWYGWWLPVARRAHGWLNVDLEFV